MRTYPVGRIVFRLRRGNFHLVTLYVVEQSLQTATETESEKDIQRGREREEMPRSERQRGGAPRASAPERSEAGLPELEIHPDHLRTTSPRWGLRKSSCGEKIDG